MATPRPAQVRNTAPSPEASQEELLRAFRVRVDEKIRADLAAEHCAAEAVRQEILPALRRAVQSARDDGWHGQVWVFGSFAWGQPNERSDVDLLIDGDERMLVRRISQLMQREIHALTIAEAPASLKERVLAHGLPL